jgi:hypothetical protein
MAVELTVRKWLLVQEEVLREAGRADGRPLRKVAAMAVVENPCAGRFEPDLSGLVEASRALAHTLCGRAREALGEAPESYGKAALVGTDGDQEHAVAMLTTIFGDIMREHAGGGKAWIPSMTKRCAPGERLDVPLAHKDALFVRSHYDGITVAVPDAPLPRELVVVAAYASRGRLNARLGGLRPEEVQGADGLR